jgi:T5SS/PEP-CTERM-associated repeat protein
LRIDDDFVTFALEGNTYTVIDGGTEIGRVAGRSGQLTVLGGAFLHAGGSESSLLIGTEDGAAGSLTVSSARAEGMRVANVGHLGDGSLRVENGGRIMVSGGMYIGNLPTAHGVTNVSGAGSTLDATDITVGRLGTATLSATGGAWIDNRYATVGDEPGSIGDAVISGAGTRWFNVREMDVGRSSTGTLTILDGAVLETDDAVVGRNASGVGNVFVQGGNATWTNSNNLTIGGPSGSGGAGALYVRSGGIVDSQGLLSLWAGGAVHLRGGELRLRSFQYDPAATFDFAFGTLRFPNSMSLDDSLLDLFVGPEHRLRELQHVAVGETLFLDTPLHLDGGTLSVASLPALSPLVFTRGTFNLTGDDLTVGNGGLFGNTLALAERSVHVTNSATIEQGARLSMQGGEFSAGAGLTNRGEIAFADTRSQIGGGLLVNEGTLRGTGLVRNAVQNATTGRIQATAAERLVIAGAVANAGEISLAGGEMQFDAAVTNSANTGAISARDAILRFGGGLTNHGSLAAPTGTADVFGKITNAAGGRIVVSGGARATFYDDVTNEGTIVVSSAGSLSSTAVFLGSFSGGGIEGGGSVFIEGDLRPGFSPGTMDFGGDVAFGPSATLEVEIGGAADGQFDRITVVGSTSLAGTLDVKLIDGFVPQERQQTYEIMTYGTRFGQFDAVDVPTNLTAPVFVWTLDYTPTSIELTATMLPPGDIDRDGTVDAGDVAAFAGHFGRDGASTWDTGDFDGDGRTSLADLALLQAHFGESVVFPTQSFIAAPEPSAGVLGFCGFAAAVGAAARRMRRRAKAT